MRDTLNLTTMTVPAAESPKHATLPPIFKEHNFQAEKPLTPAEDDGLFTDLGKVSLLLPYETQNLYTRECKERPVRTAVLENDLVRAVFLPDFGGRLWSLYDKKEERDLLYTNDCLQFANLALCNAWFSGGVEWNIGMIGHSPFTCATLHTAAAKLPDGRNVLRFYEYERIRGVYYQMDFFLDDHRPILYARMRIKNPHTKTIPMYWWSNMALPEEEGARLVVPAEESFCSTPEGIGRCPVPVADGVDITYPTNTGDAKDYFFKTLERRRRYIAYFLKNGDGFFQTSTFRLRGRKLFVWGQGRGSDTWQRWLTRDAGRYIELQAGLGQTQYECLPMPPCAAWEWLEAYGPLRDKQNETKGDYAAARAYTETQMEALLGEEELEEMLKATAPMAQTKAEQLLIHATGWGALEEARRRKTGEKPLAEHLDFGNCGPAQSAWKKLLNEGTFEAGRPDAKPAPVMVGEVWKQMLTEAHQKAPNWHSAMHLGMMAMAEQDPGAALTHFKQSNTLQKNLPACYGLAVLADCKQDKAACLRYCRSILCMISDDVSVLRDVCRLLLRCGGERVMIGALENSPYLKKDGRLRLMLAKAYVTLRRPEQAEAMLCGDGGIVVDDLREGELELSELYFALKQQQAEMYGRAFDPAKITLPSYLNFRLKADE